MLKGFVVPFITPNIQLFASGGVFRFMLAASHDKERVVSTLPSTFRYKPETDIQSSGDWSRQGKRLVGLGVESPRFVG